MLNTKSQVIHAILKQEGKRFRLHQIYDETGMSPQNTSNILRRYVERGLLIKNGMSFTVPSQEALVNELTLVNDGGHIEKAEEVHGFYIKAFAQEHNKLVDVVARARVLGLPYSGEMHVAVNQAIDQTIAEMKKLKRWLNNKSYTQNTAARGFPEQSWEESLRLFEGEF